MSGDISVSYEFFPPRNASEETVLHETITSLAPTDPSFVSMTHGAAGSKLDITTDAVEHLRAELATVVVPHITLLGQKPSMLVDLVEHYRDTGVTHLLALAGDPQPGTENYVGLDYATDLIGLIRAVGDFSIGVSAHPDVHPLSANKTEDRRRLAQKLELAEFAITQCFFDPDAYFDLVEDVSDLGVDKPIIPGLLLAAKSATLQRIQKLSSVIVPDQYLQSLYGAEKQGPDEAKKVAVEYSTKLSADLLDQGVAHLHYFTFNRSGIALEVLENLGINNGEKSSNRYATIEPLTI